MDCFGYTELKPWSQICFDPKVLYLPISIKIAAAKATTAVKTLGIAAPGTKIVSATIIRYTARRIKPIFLINGILYSLKVLVMRITI